MEPCIPLSERISNPVQSNDIFQTLMNAIDKAVNWINSLNQNQLLVIAVILAVLSAENSTNRYYTPKPKPKPLPRKEFSESTKKFTRFKQGNVCNNCKKPTDLWDFHHKDRNRSNNRPSNCEALCPYCHAEITRSKN